MQWYAGSPQRVDLIIKNYNLNETPRWNGIALVYVEWLLKATYLAVNPWYVVVIT
jgi:hypothetical protein